MEIIVRNNDIDFALRLLREKTGKDGDLKRFTDREKGKTHSRSDKRKLKEHASLNRFKRREAKAEREGYERRWTC